MMKIDLHVHTYYSEDCLTSFEAIIKACRHRGLSVAITDHNRIEGALALREIAPFPVIVGEEIDTSEGEIIGLFLEEGIPRDLTPEETIARIREQGGLVYIPHPLARDVPKALGKENLEALIEDVDILEGFNARILCQADNLAAREIAQQHGIPVAGGSDAHFAREIGRAGVELDSFATPQDLLESLPKGHVFGRRTPYLFSLVTCGLWYIDKFRELLRNAARRASISSC